LFSLNIRAASEFAGEFGLGSQSNDCHSNNYLSENNYKHAEDSNLVMQNYFSTTLGIRYHS